MLLRCFAATATQRGFVKTLYNFLLFKNIILYNYSTKMVKLDKKYNTKFLTLTRFCLGCLDNCRAYVWQQKGLFFKRQYNQTNINCIKELVV